MTFFVRTGAFRFFRLVRLIVFAAVPFTLAIGLVRAQSPDATSDLAARINRERIVRGLVPYALNAKLSAAAQAQANDMARTGRYSHTGSDGSTVFDRVARTGYGAYSWGRRLGENWAWYRDAATAMQMWMASPPHRDNILHAVYREFGIGIATVENGGFIYVIDFGAEPNVLPVFIQNGASETESNKVVIALSNEDFATSGDGANTIGKANQVQVSSSPNFAGAQWQPFATKFAWTLPSGAGTKTVYVKYRDARGRTVTSSDSIGSLAPVVTPTRITSPTPRSSVTSTKPRLTAVPTNTFPSSVTLTPVLVPLAPSLTATLEPAATDTVSPSPSMPELTETPLPVTLAMLTTETAIPTLDLQVQVLNAQALPTVAPLANSTLSQDQVTPIALGIFGLSIMLGVSAMSKWLAHRTPND